MRTDTPILTIAVGKYLLSLLNTVNQSRDYQGLFSNDQGCLFRKVVNMPD